MKKDIPVAVAKRLARYYRYLSLLDSKSVEKVSSAALSKKMNITASQIRQDLNYFGGFGQQGYGYNVKNLLDELKNILGIKNSYKAIIIGAGHLGNAIANNFNFDKRGIKLIGIFDVNSEIIGTQIKGVPITNIDDLESFLKEKQPDIAVLTLPKAQTQAVVDRLSKYKIKGLWNFSNMDINVSKNIAIENVHLGDSLLSLSFNMNGYNEKPQSK